jgi:hypothetical protein
MNTYRHEDAPLRPLFGLAAVALTAATLALAVVAPAGVDGAAPPLLADPAAPIAVAISPARLDIVAVREQKAALDSVPLTTARRTNG